MATEKRLIDANAIHYCNYDLDNYHSFCAVTDDEIAEMPTVDAVEVVRCKDCKYYEKIPDWGRFMCTKFLGLTIPNADDFCSYGERKDNDETVTECHA